jgi:tripartite-type tricarboxylate transporter receptor subunit TctC
MMKTLLLATAATLVSLTQQSGLDAAQPPTLYIGKQLNDPANAYTALMAKYLGLPDAVSKAMPGAGGIKAANYLYNNAAKDGTELMLITPPIILQSIDNKNGIHYDASKFAYIGRLFPIHYVLVVRAGISVKSIEDARRHELIVGSSAAGSVPSTWMRYLNKEYGTKFKIIEGYINRADIELAFERGECDAVVETWEDIAKRKPEWLNRNKVLPILQFLPKTEQGSIQDIPSMDDLGDTPAQKEKFALYGSISQLGNTLVGPPGMEHSKITQLQMAFQNMLLSQEFIKEANDRKLFLQPASGEQMRMIVDAFFTKYPFNN